MDIKWKARCIICEHTVGTMSCMLYEPKDNKELQEFMLDECGHILADRFLEWKYTPMEYNAIHNELAETLNNIFEPIC